jgi:lipid-A-disaccharide synthase
VPLIYLIAGEQSGDVLGARLMNAIRAREPAARFAGIGGSDMAAAGLQSLFPIRELAIMGLAEVVPRLLQLRRRLRQTVADIIQQRPSIVVTIDSPGFTLRVLRALEQQHVPRIHYVAPQVWAWREGRVRHFPGLWDELLCLLPFEPAFFARHGLTARFVGHPVLESGADRGDGLRFRQRFGLAADDRIVTVLPGSRRTEVSRLLPILEATIKRLPERITPVIPLAGPVAETVRQQTAGWAIRPILVADAADKYDAFAASSAALTKSGTTTLELAMAGVPMLVTYQVSPITYHIARRLVKVKYASIVNLVLDRPVVPELLQLDGSTDRLVTELTAVMNDPERINQQRQGFDAALALLRPSHGTPADNAAEAVLSRIQ